MAGEGWAQPPRKPPPAASQIGPHMAGIRTDEEYDGFIKDNKGQTVSKRLRCLRSPMLACLSVQCRADRRGEGSLELI